MVPVLTDEDTAGGAYWGAQLLDTTISDPFKPAQWEWKAYKVVRLSRSPLKTNYVNYDLAI